MIVLAIIAFVGLCSTIFLFTKGPYAMKDPVVEPVITPQMPPETPHISEPAPEPDYGQILYSTAFKCLGTHQTLDSSIPNEVGCGEAWSAVAKKAGVHGIPKLGYAGTANLYLWLKTNPDFLSVSIPVAGDTVISPTGYGNGTVTGHVGIVGNYHIMSNNSETGLFSDHWKLPEWKAYYGRNGGLPVMFFRWIG